MKFPYRQYQTPRSPTATGGTLFRPEIPIRVIGAAGSISLWALVDTGSDDTLFPMSMGRMIGAAVDSTNAWNVEGIGGQNIATILGEVVIELTDGNQIFRWAAKIGLVDFADPQDEVVLTGHAGFLDYFRVSFDGNLHSLEIEPTSAFPGQVI